MKRAPRSIRQDSAPVRPGVWGAMLALCAAVVIARLWTGASHHSPGALETATRSGLQRVHARAALIASRGPSHQEVLGQTAAEFLTDTDPAQCRRNLDQWIATLDLAEVRGLLEWARHTTASENTIEFVNGLLLRWLRDDPAEAADFACHWPGARLQEPVARQVLAALLVHNPAGAADFALALPRPSLRDELLNQALSRWAENDPSSAVAWAREMPEGPGKPTALACLAGAWWQNNPLDLAEFARNLPEGYGSFQTLVAARLAQQDPPSAASWAAQLAPGSQRDRVQAAVVAAWAKTSTVDAANYVAQLPPGTAQNLAALAVVSAWSNQEPLTAAQWVAEFGEGPLRDQAMRMIRVP